MTPFAERVSCVNIPNRVKLTPYLFQGPCQSLKGNELAQRITPCVTVNCSFGSNMARVLTGMRDGASVNGCQHYRRCAFLAFNR